MGTPVRLTIDGERHADAVAASEAGLRALEQTERRLSTWRDDSELARLNRSPVGAPFMSSAELWGELDAVARCRDLTSGAFDPTVGALVHAWGLRTGGRRPTTEELAKAASAVGLDALERSDGRTLTRRRADVVLEEGAFGKGAGLDRAIERIAATPGATEAVVDLGGQVAVWRALHDPTTEPVTIALSDPLLREQPVLALAIDGGSLSTSGNSERAIVVEGRRYSHLLDPRTGLPAADIGSVTVWAPTALAADCLSTGLFVLGVDEIGRFAARHPELGVVLIRADRDTGRRVAWASASLKRRLTSVTSDLDLRFWAEKERERSATEALSQDGERP